MRNRLETRVARVGYREDSCDENRMLRVCVRVAVAARESLSRRVGSRGAEAVTDAARRFSSEKRGALQVTQRQKFLKSAQERGERGARKANCEARKPGAEKRGAIMRPGAEGPAKARKRAEASRGYRQGWKPCLFVKQRASNGCQSNDRFWARVTNRTHLGRIPCEKRSEGGALLSWTHDPDADSGSGTIREGSLAPKIPLGSLASRRVPHSSGFGSPESKRRKGNRMRVLAVSMIASRRIRPGSETDAFSPNRALRPSENEAREWPLSGF